MARVLYVCGDAEGCGRHVANLKRSGHDVIMVSDAGHALTAALESGPEIVLLHGPRDDIDRDLSRRLRGIPQLSRSAIIYIGADTGVEALAWFGAGVDLVLASLPEDAAIFRLLEEALARVRLLLRNDVGSYSPRPAASAESRPAADSPSTPAADERQTILVVDDERAIRRLVEGVLRRVGYTVVAKDSPGSALEWWHEHGDEVVLVITDIVMPGGTGPEMLVTMRAKRPDLEAIIMSGYAADRPDARPEPSDRFLQKPFTPGELRSAVSETRRKRRDGGLPTAPDQESGRDPPDRLISC